MHYINKNKNLLQLCFPAPCIQKKWCNLYVHVSTFRYSGSGLMAASLRDTEWRQSHRHLALCHSSSLALTVCGDSATRQTYACVLQVVCSNEGARERSCAVVLICVRFICLYMLWFVCLYYSGCVQSVCVGVFLWWCSDVQYVFRNLLCLSLRLWLWQPHCPPRSCCHMLAASVSAEQKP